MNQRNFDQTAVRFWGPVGVAGAASAAAVVMMIGSVVSGAAASTPSTQFPNDPNPAYSVTGKQPSDPVLRGCFMGRHNWHYATAEFPQCRVK